MRCQPAILPPCLWHARQFTESTMYFLVGRTDFGWVGVTNWTAFNWRHLGKTHLSPPPPFTTVLLIPLRSTIKSRRTMIMTLWAPKTLPPTAPSIGTSDARKLTSFSVVVGGENHYLSSIIMASSARSRPTTDSLWGNLMDFTITWWWMGSLRKSR